MINIIAVNESRPKSKDKKAALFKFHLFLPKKKKWKFSLVMF